MRNEETSEESTKKLSYIQSNCEVYYVLQVCRTIRGKDWEKTWEISQNHAISATLDKGVLQYRLRLFLSSLLMKHFVEQQKAT